VSGPRLAPLATFGLLFSAAAAAAAGAGPPAPLSPKAVAVDLAEVVSPPPGEDLIAGETAWIEWRDGPGLSRFARAVEWEAFLSLDGGRSFPVRLTPHLDLGRSRVAFQVPPFASPDVRLLLRFGDETEEREQPVAARFCIVAGAAPLLTSRRRAPLPGEAARPGDPGVVLWAEGARDGSGWREVETRSPLHDCAPAIRPQPSWTVAAEAPRPQRPAGDRRAAGACRSLPRARSSSEPSPSSALAAPLLLLLHRLNR
jgi:hypothetical protein